MIRGFGVLAGAFVVHSAALAVISVHLVLYLVSLGHPPARAAALAGVLGLLSVTGRLVTSLSARWLPMATITAGILFVQGVAISLLPRIKNSGVGNGMPDYSDVVIEIVSHNHVIIWHGWTEMGQGVQNIAIQTLVQETGISPKIIDVRVDTLAGIPTGMTTSSRATALLGNAIIDASKKIIEDLKKSNLSALAGRRYKGRWICDWTTKPGADVKKIVTHFAYGYATQLVVLNEKGEIDTIFAAHDAGRILNPMQFEGQVEGGVHMGLGYALTEDLPMEKGFLKSTRLRDCGVLRAKETPRIVVLGVEKADPCGPYGAKGLGEIGLVPTAAAVANAFYTFDKVRRYKLPMKKRREINEIMIFASEIAKDLYVFSFVSRKEKNKVIGYLFTLFCVMFPAAIFAQDGNDKMDIYKLLMRDLFLSGTADNSLTVGIVDSTCKAVFYGGFSDSINLKYFGYSETNYIEGEIFRRNFVAATCHFELLPSETYADKEIITIPMAEFRKCFSVPKEPQNILLTEKGFEKLIKLYKTDCFCQFSVPYFFNGKTALIYFQLSMWY